jgi:TPR repeat protein
MKCSIFPITLLTIVVLSFSPMIAMQQGSSSASGSSSSSSSISSTRKPEKPGTDASTASAAEEKKESKEERKFNEQVTSTRVSASSSTTSSTTSSAAVADESTLSADQLCNQAKCFANGDGVVKDEKHALTLFRKAAALGGARAMCCLGIGLEWGIGVEEDKKAAAKEEAFTWHRKAAALDNADAMTSLGYCLQYGIGVKENKEEAVTWYRKAADKNQLEAMYNLGICLQYGIGVKENKEEAVTWYRKAAEAGNPGAMYNLGCCLHNGIGVAVDLLAASDWFSKAAKAGYASAQAAVGIFLLLGRCEFGVNCTKAVAWLEKAAQQNDYTALCWLGHCRKYGLGTVLDRDAANALFKRAAEQQGKAAVAAWLNARLGLQVAQSEPVFDCFNKDCPICTNKLWPGQCILRLDCCHGFHPQCLQRWLQQQREEWETRQKERAAHGEAQEEKMPQTCPICRDDAKQAVAGTAL